MSTESLFVQEAKATLNYYAKKTTSCTVYVTEVVAGSCLDFIVSEARDFKNKINWFASRREGFLVRAPLDKKQLEKLTKKYRLETDSFSDKQWGLGFSATVYGDGMYGHGPGSLSLVIDEGWMPSARSIFPNRRMPYEMLLNNCNDAAIPPQPILFKGTPGTVDLDKILSRPSAMHAGWPLYGIALHFSFNENREAATIELAGPDWGKFMMEQ